VVGQIQVVAVRTASLMPGLAQGDGLVGVVDILVGMSADVHAEAGTRGYSLADMPASNLASVAEGTLGHGPVNGLEDLVDVQDETRVARLGSMAEVLVRAEVEAEGRVWLVRIVPVVVPVLVAVLALRLALAVESVPGMVCMEPGLVAELALEVPEEVDVPVEAGVPEGADVLGEVLEVTAGCESCLDLAVPAAVPVVVGSARIFGFPQPVSRHDLAGWPGLVPRWNCDLVAEERCLLPNEHEVHPPRAARWANHRPSHPHLPTLPLAVSAGVARRPQVLGRMAPATRTVPGTLKILESLTPHWGQWRTGVRPQL
jgi:hypothetical protein